jgi:hypothetical protein
MLQHKQPGKGSLTSSTRPDHDHQPGPGKHTRVEQAGHGPIASAASASDGDRGAETSLSASGSGSFHEGEVLVKMTVAIKLSHGEGPVSIDVSGGGIGIGNEKMGLDFKSPNAATGKSLDLTGLSVTTAKHHTQKSAVKIEDGYIGQDIDTTWTVKTKHWSGTIAISSFTGVKRPPPKPHGIVHRVIHAIEHSVEKVAHAVVEAGDALVHSAPKWGPILLAALAAVASAPESVATG